MERTTLGATTTNGRYGLAGALRNLAFTIALATTSAAAAPLAAQPVTLVAFGDSLTHGYGLPEEEGFVPRLQSWLRANGAPDVTVVNAGVSGDTSAGGLARIDWTLSEPADALILALGANDVLRGIDPDVTRANLDGILTATDARGLPVLLAGIPAPGNYGPDYQARFDAIFPDLAAKHGAILYPNFLAGLGDRPDLTTVGPLMQPDGLHPNAAGVTAVVAAIGPAALELVAAARGAPALKN